MNKILLSLLFLISFCNIPVKLPAQNFSPEEIEILTLQDKRTLGANNELLNYLKSGENRTVIRALLAIANIADTNTISAAGEMLLTHPGKDVRSIAAFALGQIPSAASIDYLNRSLGSEKDNDVLVQVIDALGKIGDEASYNMLLSYKIADPKLNEAVALSIARYGIRKVRNADGVLHLESLVQNGDASIKRMSAYTFARGMDKTLLTPAKETLKILAVSDDPHTRMWAFNALGKLADPADIDFITSQYNSESDWKVKVNILNVIPNYKTTNPEIYNILTSLTPGENINVGISKLNNLGKLYSSLEPASLPPDLKGFFESYLSQRSLKPWHLTAEALNSYALIYKDEAKEQLLRDISDSPVYNIKAAAIRSFSYFNDPMVYKEVREKISAVVQEYNKTNPNTTGAMIGSEDLAKLYRAFVEMLTALDDKMDTENKNVTRLIYSEFGSSKDPYITAVALSALTDSLYLQYREETSQVILFDFNELNDRDNPDVTQIYIETLAELGAKDAVKILEEKKNSVNYDIAKSSASALEKITGVKQNFTTERYMSYNWDFLNSLPQEVFITLNTAEGDIKLKLFPHVAPFTVVNFIKLAQIGYFNNTVFHRVIPNFVVQGGDPTGTGYSGPGYSMRSEFSPLQFTTGILGMASSGKDTEGSQFFITHSPQYHLDGKYTIFGEVVEGMDVVNGLYIGDKLESVTYP